MDCFKENLIFIGLPGCGKSVISEKVSKLFAMDLIDLDKLLINEIGPLQNYIDRYGNEEFKKKECQICSKYLSNIKDKVISPGGSIVFYSNLMDYIKRKSIVIFLDVHINTVLQRTNNFKDRGVILPNNEINKLTLQEQYNKLYEIRSELCKSYCDIHIKNNNITINQVIRAIMTFKSKHVLHY